jgi:hypothetical protein
MPEMGDFEVVPTGGEGGRLIRLGQYLNGSGFANYEHARLYLGDGMIVEAEPGGARIVPLYASDGGLWSTGIISLTTDERQNIAKFGRLCDGVGYSGLDYFALAAHRFRLHPLDNTLKGRVESSHHLICSQLVDYCYMMAGVHLFTDGRWPGYVTPADLAELLLHHKQPR